MGLFSSLFFLFLGEHLLFEVIDWFPFVLLLHFGVAKIDRRRGFSWAHWMFIAIFIIVWLTWITAKFSIFLIFGDIWVSEELICLEVVHEDAYCLEAEKAWQVLSQLPKETFVVTLGTNLTRQLQSVNYLLLSLFDLLDSISSLKPHWQVLASHLKDLHIWRLESQVLLISILLRLTLNNNLDFIIIIHDWLCQKLYIFYTILDVFRQVETTVDLSWLITYSINHLAALEHEPLMEYSLTRFLFNSPDSLGGLLSQNKDCNTCR